MTYRERLWPAAWVWMLMLGVAVMLAAALAFALGPVWGVSTLLGCVLLMVLVVLATVSTITVSPFGVHVDRAFLPRASISGVRTLDRTEMRLALRSPPGTTYLAVRPWACREGVLVALDDASDPHAYWLVSSRHREAFAQAILEATTHGPHDRLAPGRDV